MENKEKTVNTENKVKKVENKKPKSWVTLGDYFKNTEGFSNLVHKFGNNKPKRHFTKKQPQGK